MNEYLVPLGIDGQKVVAGLDQTIGMIGKVEDKANEAGRSIEESFGKGAKGADTLEAQLKPTEKTLEGIRNASKSVGTELANAFNIKKAGTDFTNQINSFKKQLKDVTDKKKIGLEVDKKTIKDLQDATNYLKSNFTQISTTFTEAGTLLDGKIESAKANIADTASYVKELEKSLKGIAPGTVKLGMESDLRAAKQALDEENAALADYEESLKEIDAANKNLSKTLAEANTAVEELAASQSEAGAALNEVAAGEDNVTAKGKSLKAELREIKAALQAMELAGESGSQQFFDLSVRAGELEDQIGDTNAQIRTLASDSKYLDATVSGVTGLVGAFTLAQGAAGLLGVENEELQEALLKVNSAMAVLQGLQAVAEVLNKDSAFSVIFLRNARTADAAATTVQTTATVGQTVATRAATVATKGLGLAFKAMGIGLIIGLIAFLYENWNKVTESLNKLLPVGKSVGGMFDSIKSVALGVGNAVLQYLVMPFRALTALLSVNLSEFKNIVMEGFNFKKNFTDGFNKQELANERAHQKELEKARIEADARDLERRKNRGENVDKQEIALQKRRVALQAKDSDAYKENLTKLEDLQDGFYKTQADAQKTAATDAQKKREEAAKKALEIEQKNQGLVLEYTRAAIDLRIAAIANEGERERAQVNEEFRRKLEDLAKNTDLSARAQQAQIQLELQLSLERDAKIKAIEDKTAKDRLAIQEGGQKAIADLMKEGTARDLELLRLDHVARQKEITETYKDDEELRTMLTASLEASTAREKKKILDESAKRALEEEEERQLLAIDLASQYAKKNENTERQKQIAILETKIEYAEKALDLAIATGGSENSLQVLQARKQLKDLKEGLQTEIKANNGKGFSFMEFIGLGDLTDDQSEAVKKAGAMVADSLGQITDFIVDQYQRQIDKKQESIDQLDDEISDLESRLDEENELRENGFANNVAMIEAELAEKQREKDEEVKQQEELMRKKQAMQRAQMAVDTAIQLVNMITASTEIFKALAGIPFIGVPLAIATIGTMFGAFTVAKVKAAQSISDQKFEHGGYIGDGASHAQGGKKYYSKGGDVVELEQGEFVVKKKQTKKFAKVLEAINNGTFSALSMSDAGLSEMLRGMGISFNETSSKKGLSEANDVNNMKFSVTVTNPDSKDMKEMNENIKFLAQQERERTTSWEDDKYFYTKTGSKLTRILKTPKTPVENGTN